METIELGSKIQYLSGVGPKMAAKLNKLGIVTVSDLIFYYPRAYKDFTKIQRISEIRSLNYGETISIRGKIIGIANKKTSRRHITVTEAVVEDESGSIKIVWFNQPFLTKILTVGREIILNGKFEYNFFSKEVVMESPERTLKPCIVPVYSETAGITSKYISRLVSSIKEQISSIDEWLPEHLLHHPEFITRYNSQEFKALKDCSCLSSGSQGDGIPKPIRQAQGVSEIESQVRDDSDGFRDDKRGYDLLPIQTALLNIHFPQNSEMIDAARRRIAFDELLMIALRANLSKEELKKESAPKIEISDDQISRFTKSFPYELTGDQKKAAGQILKDLAKPVPMNRLLNGDVGSGKTVVAAIAAYGAIKAGFRVAVMCPTEILAQQHFKTFCGLFNDHNISVGVYTANFKDNFQFKISNLKSISNSQIINKKQKESDILNSNIIIGTHALIQKDVELENLGLVVIDEQHRFGVKQRQALLELRTDEKLKPHFLSMTATPIPRTLHLALFGDLDLSVIREKPKDRKEIKTRFVESKNREKAYDFIRAHIEAGRQAFIICPLIEDKEISNDEFLISNQISSSKSQVQNLFEQDRKSVKAEYEKLQKIFPDFKIEMLHGKMPATARSRTEGGRGKEEIMAEFSEGKIDILVSTSVVEVGIDVPNATVMMVEDAERFGLAQIHQFRGRVGRGEHQSFCFLFSSTMSSVALERMKSLEMTSDGFRLAEIDLEQRGPGAVFGTEQSGMLDLKMANFSDRNLIEEASSAAKEIIEADPDLKNHPALKEKIKNLMENRHLE